MPTRTRFVDLLGTYDKEIHRYAYRMTGNAEDAADVLQDTFLKAFRAFSRLPVDANHRAWLYRIAHREALNLFRSRKVREAGTLEEVSAVNDANGHPDDIAETRRLVQALRHVIRGLTPRQRSALLLKKYEGLPYAEVAAILGCSEDNARAQVYQAMKKIRNGLRRS
jgi:RNA polymerase sigma-70 factor (ECF subfamily)